MYQRIPSQKEIDRLDRYYRAAAYIVWSSVYTVNDQERAVITTFGSVTGTADAGIHFLVPFGVQQAHIVEVNAIKRIEIGYRTTDDGSTAVAVENESKMITGDFNIVNIDFFIEYRITDPENISSPPRSRKTFSKYLRKAR